MANVHNAITRGQWTSAIKAALGVSKESGGIERFGETLTPIVNLWDLDVPEWPHLRDETLFAGTINAVATAGEFSYVGIGLPTAATDLMVIEEWSVRSGNVSITLQSMTRAVAAATLALSFSPVNRDQRFAGTAIVRLVNKVETWIGSDISLTLGTNAEELLPVATEFRQLQNMPWVIRPGGVIAVRGDTVNTSIQTNVLGRVRSALPGELE